MKNLNQMLKKYSSFLLVIIFVIALMLRWIYLPYGAITFGYDQGRDAFIAQQINGGHLKILGPPVGGLPGIFHGVFYYYVIAPAYFFGHGNPVVVAYWMSFLNSLGVFVVFMFALSITAEIVPALIASLIFAFSFEATQYANWLSNPSLGILFVPLIYFGLWLWLKKRNKVAQIITGASLGLSIQCNAALAFHLLPVLFWLYNERQNIKPKQILIFTISLFLSVLTMVVSEIKFEKGGLSGIWYLFSSQDRIAGSMQLSDFFTNYFNQIGHVFSLTLFPMSTVFGGILGLLLSVIVFWSWYSKKDRKNLSWQLILLSAPISYAFALSFGGSSTPHITVGTAALISIMFGIVWTRLLVKNKFLAVVLLLIILSSNLFKIITENKYGQTNFMIQKGLILSDELKAVDYTYSKSEGKPFSISTLTSPLFINTTWSYLYNWYGVNKFGYLPYWIGRDQIGQLGNNLSFPPKGISQHFYITEPTYSIPELYIIYAKGDQNSISKIINSVSFGKIVVENRFINILRY
jgi:hypothetical protein